MRRLAKNLILTAATVSAIFLVDLSPVEAASLNQEKVCPYFNLTDEDSLNYLDFWGKFRETVMPDEPQDNNPPKEMKKPKPAKNPPATPPKPARPPKVVRPNPAD